MQEWIRIIIRYREPSSEDSGIYYKFRILNKDSCATLAGLTPPPLAQQVITQEQKHSRVERRLWESVSKTFQINDDLWKSWIYFIDANEWYLRN